MNTSRRMLLAAPLVALGSPAMAQNEWPRRPIRLIVAYAPGGATDASARVLAPRMAERLGQSIVIENRTGGGGTIAASAVAQAAPDGYTLLCDTFSHVVNPLLRNNLPFDYNTAFTGVTRIASFPQVIVVKDGSPYANLGALIAAARARPGTISIGFAGLGTASHILLERLRHETGGALNTIPYRGASEAARDVAGGTLDAAVLAFSTAVPLDDGKQARMIGVATAERVPTRPNVPTFIESGLPDFVVSDFAGIFAPAGTPLEIRVKLQNAVIQSLGEPATSTRLREMGVLPAGEGAEEFASWIGRTRADMAKLIREAGIRVE